MTPLWVSTVAASIGAGLIHLALGPEHVEELGGLGYGFYLAAVLQLGWAVAFLASRGARPAIRAGIAINVAILLAWAVSRTVGLPAGEMPWVPEAIGRADAITAVLQAAIVIGLARSRSVGRAEARPSGLRRSATVAAAAVLVIGASTSVGLLPGGHAHAGEQANGSEPGHGHAGGGDQAPSHPSNALPADAEIGLAPAAPPRDPGALGTPGAPARPTDAPPKRSEDHPHESGAPDHAH